MHTRCYKEALKIKKTIEEYPFEKLIYRESYRKKPLKNL